MKTIQVLIKPASSACNLRCKYCFYADVASRRGIRSYGFMTEQTMNHILQNLRTILNSGDQVYFAFQGGEPTLVGLDFFQRFTSITSQWKDIKINYSIQTNGILLDSQWISFLQRNNYLVGISFDILPEYHNTCRVDAEGKGTYQQVLSCIQHLEAHSVKYNVLCTLTAQIARHPMRVWNKIKSQCLSYVQFTPCLGEFEETAKSPYALTPMRFAEFYNVLFSLWYKDLCCGHYRSIKFFDDVVNLILYGVPSACGMNGICSPQIVIESDGSVYPCDFYCLDSYRIGNLAEQSWEELESSSVLQNFRYRTPRHPVLCTDCKYHNFCGGGCRRMQREVYCSAESHWCGYRDFLDNNINSLLKIANWQKYEISPYHLL